MIYFVGPSTPMQSTQYSYVGIDYVVDYCRHKKFLGVDTETEGFDFLTKKMIMFQIGDDENQFVIDTRHVSIEPLRSVLESKDITKILHNVKFDYKFILKWADIKLENIWDSMLIDQTIHCGKYTIRYSLKELCRRYLDINLDKETRNQFVGLTGQPFRDDQIVYGAKDVAYLIQIQKIQAQALEKHKLVKVAELENNVALSFADIEYNGIKLDTETWKSIAEDSKIDVVQYEETLDNFIMNDSKFSNFVNHNVQSDLFIPLDEIRKVIVKWSSPTQVLKVFQIIFPDLENVNGKELFKYVSNNFIAAYIKYKEKAKLATSYGLDFLKNVNKVDSKIHTSFNQILNTGRVASNSPNMQQIPADNKFRRCFIPDEGHVLVSADYSSQELCIIAVGSKDPVWIEALKDGKDLHGLCADLVFEDRWRNADEKERKNLRTMIKTINFGLAYGMGPHKLSNTLQITIEDAEALIEKYFTVFPSIKKFLASLGSYGKRLGYIRTYKPYSRIRWFEDWSPSMGYTKDSMKIMGAIERASKNTPIQGTGADMTKLALSLLRETINNNNLPVKIVMTVHDQIDTMCPKDYAKEWSEILRDKMEEAAQIILGTDLLKADPNITDKWEK